MPVQSPHPDYEKMDPMWQKERLALKGEDAVKLAKEKFLPRLAGMDDAEFDNYVLRAMYYAAAKRTVQGLVGAILRKDVEITFPQEDVLDSIGQDGRSMNQLISEQLSEVVGIGRFGHLVDASNVDGSDPYIASYAAESIVNWREAVFEGKKVTTMIVLAETRSVPIPEDPFRQDSLKIFRVLKLGIPTVPGRFGSLSPEDRLIAFGVKASDIQDGPIYFQEIWVEVKEDADGQPTEMYEHEDTVVPKMAGGRVLHEIPFTFYNSEDLEPPPKVGPLLDLINVNFSHYRNSADLEHGRHFTALPTAWVAGFDPSSTHLKIGSAVAWVTEEVAARAGFLEFTGAGLGHLAEGMVQKEHLMAVLGARLLEEQKTGIEAADTVKLRHSGESSVLSLISQSAARGLTRTLKLVADWMSSSASEVRVELNTDFDTNGLDPRVIAELIKAAQAGLMSWDTFFINMKRGELVPSGRTADEELSLIKSVPIDDASNASVAPAPEGSSQSLEEK